MTELAEDAPLTADEILTFGPVIEAVTWHPVFLQEARAPIAVQAGRPKLGPVFNSDGVGKAVIIRPCVSRGRRIRGLPPVYTPAMLERHSGVFDGWPMFTDHVPAELAAKLAKNGRSVRELGGQVLKGGWSRDFVQESDGDFGYQRGGVLAEIWATPLIRKTVGENPNLLHTSIHAWPTSGKPGPVPWRAAAKGMLIEGIRRLPQGSVDFVVRGGAGGKLLLAEGLEEEGAWPEAGEWGEEATRLVVSITESLYASAAMPDLTLPTQPSELRSWLQENAPHLVAAIPAESTVTPPAAPAAQGTPLTEADVQRLVGTMLEQAQSGLPTVEDFETRLREQTERTLAERETQRSLSEHACALIEGAKDILPRWKADLKTRYSMTPDGPPASLLVEGNEVDDKGAALTARQVVEGRVGGDLDHVRDLIAEAQGKPRVKGEGGAKPDLQESATTTTTTPDKKPGAKPQSSGIHWRQQFAAMGLAESEDDALAMFGGVEG